MPAAAVIPAPIAYIKVVAVKKLVVGFWRGSMRRPYGLYVCGYASFWRSVLLLTEWGKCSDILL